MYGLDEANVHNKITNLYESFDERHLSCDLRKGCLYIYLVYRALVGLRFRLSHIFFSLKHIYFKLEIIVKYTKYIYLLGINFQQQYVIFQPLACEARG